MLFLVFLFFVAEIDFICSKIIYFKIITFIAFLLCAVYLSLKLASILLQTKFFTFVKSGGYSTENLWSTGGRYMYINV